jgi:hypothetical protein
LSQLPSFCTRESGAAALLHRPPAAMQNMLKGCSCACMICRRSCNTPVRANCRDSSTAQQQQVLLFCPCVTTNRLNTIKKKNMHPYTPWCLVAEAHNQPNVGPLLQQLDTRLTRSPLLLCLQGPESYVLYCYCCACRCMRVCCVLLLLCHQGPVSYAVYCCCCACRGLRVCCTLLLLCLQGPVGLLCVLLLLCLHGSESLLYTAAVVPAGACGLCCFLLLQRLQGPESLLYTAAAAVPAGA